MKKILVVLTILVLVAGFAFADISGKVSAEYSVVGFGAVTKTNADGSYATKNFTVAGYNPTSKELAASVTLDKQIGGKTGENLPYVDLVITAEYTLVYENREDYAVDLNKPVNKFELSVDTFAIVGEEWSVNLLKAEGAKLDLAKSAVDAVVFNKDSKDENTQKMSMAKDIAYAKGISVTYKGFVAGLGFTTDNLKDKNAAITAEVKTPEFVFGDVKVQAGVGFSQTGYVAYSENTKSVASRFYYALEGPIFYDAADTPTKENLGGAKVFAGSAKVAYDSEAAKASVAFDFSTSSAKNEALFDFAANVEVAPVTVDVYFANHAQVKSSKYTFEKYEGDDPVYSKVTVKADNLLSGKVVFDVAKLAEDVPVKVTITGKDLLNRTDNAAYHARLGKEFGKIVDVEVNTTALKDFDITATAGDLFNKSATYAELDVKYTGIEKVTLEADVSYTFAHKTVDLDLDAKYEAEKYTLEGEVEIITDFEETVLCLAASAETDKIVDGAKLYAKYGTIIGYNLASSVKVSSLGAFTIGCEVEF